MILDKLTTAEKAARHYANQDNSRLTAINTIRELLNQIDFSAEVVPEEDPERVIKLLVSLKGEQLSGNEINLVYELV